MMSCCFYPVAEGHSWDFPVCFFVVPVSELSVQDLSNFLPRGKSKAGRLALKSKYELPSFSPQLHMGLCSGLGSRQIKDWKGAGKRKKGSPFLALCANHVRESRLSIMLEDSGIVKFNGRTALSFALELAIIWFLYPYTEVPYTYDVFLKKM